MGDRPLSLRQGEVRELESGAKPFRKARRSFEHVLPSGGVLRPFRDSPLGLIDELEGQMAFHRQRAGEG